MKLYDSVVLKNDIVDKNLKSGDIGVIVHIYINNDGYEVEFITGGGNTISVESLDCNVIRPLKKDEIFHIRNLSKAS